jgi:hypothetical protein
MINKEVYHITFNIPSGFLQIRESFYKRMANRTIVVAAEDVSIYVYILIFLADTAVQCALCPLNGLFPVSSCFLTPQVRKGKSYPRTGHEGPEGE